MSETSEILCGSCGGAMTAHPRGDGSGRWSCPCGRCHGAWLAEGALDIGIIDKEVDG